MPAHAVELQRHILQEAHLAAACRSAESLRHALRAARVVWDTLPADAIAWAASSPQRQATAHARPNAPSSSTSAPRGTFEPTLAPSPDYTVYADFFPLPDARYILVLIDAFTRWVFLHLCRSASATAVIDALSIWKDEHGFPCVLRCDGARSFDSRALSAWCLANGVRLPLGCPQHSAGQGMVERRMSELTRTLQALQLASPSAPVASLVAPANVILNDAVVRTTGFSPFHLRFGHPRRTALAAQVGLPPAGPTSGPPLPHLGSLHALQRLSLTASSVAQAASAARHLASAPSASFEPGDHVLLLSDTDAKLDTVGVIHVVAEKVGSTEYIIHRPFTPDERRRAAAERLAPYDASRTDLAADAVRFLAPGSAIIMQVVSCEPPAAADPAALPTYTVLHPGGSSSSGWTALSLAGTAAFKAFRHPATIAPSPSVGTATALPPPVGPAAALPPARNRPGRPPKPGSAAWLRRAAAASAPLPL